MTTKLKFIDLFAGIGGFHEAMKPFGDCVFASEWDEYAAKVYELNHRKTPEQFRIAGDITKVQLWDMPDFDVLCGGFPCQGFSIAGTQAGFNHKSGNLFFEIMRIVEFKRPSVILLENVPRLVTHEDGRTMEIIWENLVMKVGYKFKHFILNAKTHGNLPQNRERVFIIGFREQAMFDAFEELEPVPLTKKLFGDCVNNIDKAPDNYYQVNMDSRPVQQMHEKVIDKNRTYQSRRKKVRPSRPGICPCLMANMGTGGHNVPLIKDGYGIRKLTPRECFNIQGFSTDFKLPEDVAERHLYKMAGNSIPLGVVSRLTESIAKTFQYKGYGYRGMFRLVNTPDGKIAAQHYDWKTMEYENIQTCASVEQANHLINMCEDFGINGWGEEEAGM